MKWHVKGINWSKSGGSYLSLEPVGYYINRQYSRNYWLYGQDLQLIAKSEKVSRLMQIAEIHHILSVQPNKWETE